MIFFFGASRRARMQANEQIKLIDRPKTEVSELEADLNPRFTGSMLAVTTIGERLMGYVNTCLPR